MKTLLINTRSLPNQPIFSCKDNIDQIAKSPNIPDYSILQLDSDSFETGIAFSLLRLQYGHPLVTLFWVVQGLVNIRFFGDFEHHLKKFLLDIISIISYHIPNGWVRWKIRTFTSLCSTGSFAAYLPYSKSGFGCVILEQVGSKHVVRLNEPSMACWIAPVLHSKWVTTYLHIYILCIQVTNYP